MQVALRDLVDHDQEDLAYRPHIHVVRALT